ncbi:MAG: hypothetical protein O6928_02470 [Gammaproteobacteria bacterium]|nr:hypothetical protein [Gammaproteobacteria bacterium]
MDIHDENHEDLKPVIRKVFVDIDDGLTPPAFDKLWNAARIKSIAREKRATGRLPLFIYGLARPLPAFIVIACLVLVIAFITATDDVEMENQKLEEFLANNEYHSTLGPKSTWYGETDSLLDISVLKYERQYLTFANYNPVSMEIRE